jgi:hypothetical protein
MPGTLRAGPPNPEESAAALATLADQVVRGGLGEDVGASLCSPYLDHNETRYVQVLSENSHGRGTHRLMEVLGENQPADFEVPERLDPLLTLALGLRAGYPGKPPLPLGRGSEETAEHLPNEYVRYALSISQDRPWPGRASGPGNGLGPDAGRAGADRQVPADRPAGGCHRLSPRGLRPCRCTGPHVRGHDLGSAGMDTRPATPLAVAGELLRPDERGPFRRATADRHLHLAVRGTPEGRAGCDVA